MDTNASTTAWVVGAVVVIALILGAWIFFANSKTMVGVPNTGVDSSQSSGY